MKANKFIFATLTGLAVLGAQSSFAINEAAKELQAGWDKAKYQTEAKQREAAFKQLAEQAKTVEKMHPKDAEVLVWEAIILSSYAGEKGGLGALGLVKDAKSLLERAEQIDAKVLDGAVYTSLGSLYYQVPGWPVGFGDDERAGSYLRKALSIAPNDIDANYFYGDYLIEEGKYAEAVSVLENALNAPPRSQRDVADAGRKKEVQALLEKARAKM